MWKLASTSTTAELVCFSRLSSLLFVSASLDGFPCLDVRTLAQGSRADKAQVHIHPTSHAHVSSVVLIAVSRRRLHSLHLLPHHLSDHSAVPTAQHRQLPRCGGQTPCVLPLRTLAPWPRTSLPQVMSPTTTSSQRLISNTPRSPRASSGSLMTSTTMT